MTDVRERRVILGVTGSVAAFKSVSLASKLAEAGVTVRTVLTNSATRFVGAESFSGVTRQPVSTSLWKSTPHDLDHTDLAHWADLIVVAPASAHTLARAALGLTNDLLSSILLATTTPVLMAPAMETVMYNHPATQAHIEVLRSRGVTIVGPIEGRLASGRAGAGRMVEPETLLPLVLELLHGSPSALGNQLHNNSVLVTAGPTREPIDPVRFISNRSSGKMGFQLALSALRRGARVTLVAGPVDDAILPDIPREISRIDVQTAEEMRAAVMQHSGSVDAIVMAAAVADFRPVEISDRKIKKSDGMKSVALEPTRDILLDLKESGTQAIRVGFAAETDNLGQNGTEKLAKKGLALLIANDVRGVPGTVFGSDLNRVTVLRPGQPAEELPVMPKSEVAERIMDRIVLILSEQSK